MWQPGSGVVLDVSIPDLCRLSYFEEQVTEGELEVIQYENMSCISKFKW